MSSFDHWAAEWIAGHRVTPLTDVARFLERLGTSAAFFSWVLLIGLVLIVVRRAWGGLPSVATSLLVTLAIGSRLKGLFDRPRPPADLAITTLSGYSMPSTHAILTSACVTAVVMAPWWTSARWRRIVLVAGAAGCVVSAAAMVYLGGHWVSDILVGWAFGTGCTAAGMRLWRVALSARRRSVSP